MLEYKRYFYRKSIMAIIPNTWGPTVSEKPGDFDTKCQAEERFTQRWRDANFKQAREELMNLLWIWWFDPKREATAKEFVNREEFRIEYSDRMPANFDNIGPINCWVEHNINTMSLWINEHPDSPFIQRLVWDNVIPEWKWTEYMERLALWENFSDIISRDTAIPNEIRSLITAKYQEIYHSDESIAEWNVTTFQNDFSSELQLIKETIEVSADRWEGIINEVWAVYITWNNPEEKHKAFEMAISIAINTNLDTVKQSFHKTVEFEVLFQDVKNTTLPLRQRLEAYSDVIDMLYTDTWAKWRKGQKENEANIKRLQLKRSWMQEMFDKASQELRQARERQDVNQIQKLEREIKDIISQTRQIINTPIWNFDKALDWERVDTEPSIETA